MATNGTLIVIGTHTLVSLVARNWHQINSAVFSNLTVHDLRADKQVQPAGE